MIAEFYLYSEIISAILIGLIGLCVGSFITMASYRIPRCEGIAIKRSHCPKCQHKLGAGDLIPLFSWIFQFGKCRYCKAKISARYPLTEFATAALFILTYYLFDMSREGILFYMLVTCLMIITVIDFEHYLIPDSLQIALLGIAATHNFVLYSTSFVDRVYAGLFAFTLGAIVYAVFLLIMKKEGMGIGDIKFMGIAGFFLGFHDFVTFLFLTGVIGIFLGLAWKHIKKSDAFPYGPALSASLLICLYYPRTSYVFWDIMSLYMIQ